MLSAGYVRSHARIAVYLNRKTIMTTQELIQEYLNEGNICEGMETQDLIETRCDHILDLTSHSMNEAMHVRALEGLKALYQELLTMGST